MPAIFHRINDEWCAECFATKQAVLSFVPMRITIPEAAHSYVSNGTIELFRLDTGREWIAIVPEGLQIKHNGVRVAAGLRVLDHGDWLSAAQGAPVFFSTEETACTETFLGPESISCPRCKSAIVTGHAVVRCPDGGVIHHELADRNCWTYAPKCALCSCPTALDTALRWSPEAL